MQGARLVARAWIDSDFKQRLLSNGTYETDQIRYDDLKQLMIDFSILDVNIIIINLCDIY